MWNSDFHADKQLTWHLHESTNGLCLKQYFIIYKFFNCSGFLAEKSNELIDSFRCQIGGQHKYDQAVKVIVFFNFVFNFNSALTFNFDRGQRSQSNAVLFFCDKSHP